MASRSWRSALVSVMILVAPPLVFSQVPKVKSKELIVSWQTMTSFADETLKQAREHDVNTLILEFEPNAKQPGRAWNTLLDDLAFDDFAPLVAKRGKARENVQTLRDDIARLSRTARGQHIDLYLVVTEMSFPPGMAEHYPGASDMNSKFLWRFLESRLSEVLQALPDVAGIVLYTDEPADFTVYEGKGSAPQLALKRLLTLYRNVCRRFGRRFVVTTFLDYDPHKMDLMVGVLNSMPAGADFIVDNYICPGDWGLVRLVNPAIDRIKHHRQFLTFDYTGEVWGQANIPLCQAQLMYDRLKSARESGAPITGVNGYVSWYTQSIFGTPSSINLDLATKFLHDPTLQPRTAVHEWLQKRYGPQAAAKLTAAFLNSFATADKAIQLLGFWVAEAPKSAFPTPDWIAYSLRTESLAVWDPAYAKLEAQLARPDADLLQRAIREKDEAAERAEDALRAVEESKTLVRNGDYAQLHKQFNLAWYVARAFRVYTELYLRFCIWNQSGRGPVPQTIKDLEDSTETLAHEMEQVFGCLPVFCPQSLLDGVGRLRSYIREDQFPDYWSSKERTAYPPANWDICARKTEAVRRRFRPDKLHGRVQQVMSGGSIQ